MYMQSADLRLGNARRVLAALMRGWPCPRPELARRTGLSAMTVGKVAEQLLELGLLDEAPGEPVPGLGRPPRQLSPNPRPRFVAVELGVHRTELYRIGLAGEPAPLQRASVTMPGDRQTFFAAVAAARAALGDEVVDGVLVSVPGVLDSQAPAIVYSPNLHWSEGRELLAGLGAMFAAPVCAVQEAQALALGHLAVGHLALGAAPEHFLMVDFGDGIGSAVVTSGRLLGGPLPLSGEIGHTPVPGNARACGCGAVGCIETLAGRAGVLRSAAANGLAADWSTLRQQLHAAPLPAWMLETLDALAMVLAGALNLLGLREVIVVGDVAELHPEVVPELGRRLAAHSLLGRFARVECRLAAPHRAAGLLAAAIDRLLLPETSRPAAR